MSQNKSPSNSRDKIIRSLKKKADCAASAPTRTGIGEWAIKGHKG